MTYEEIKEMSENVSAALVEVGKAFRTFLDLVYDVFAKVAKTLVEATSGDFIKKLIDTLKFDKKADKPKYDKNISHFQHINKPYNQPYYKIRPTARTHCRR